MISFPQTRNKSYNINPRNSTCHVCLFAIVIGRDISVLFGNCKIITPIKMTTTLNTWSGHTSCLMYTSIEIQGQLPHQRMELHFLIKSQKRIMIRIMMIGSKLPSVINVARRGTVFPTVQTQIQIKTMINKAPIRTRISHVKISQKRKSIRNMFNFY